MTRTWIVLAFWGVVACAPDESGVTQDTSDAAPEPDSTADSTPGGEGDTWSDGIAGDASADAGAPDAAADIDTGDDAIPGDGVGPTEEEVCVGGKDEDGDELADCEDPDCADLEHCAPLGCTNGIDDDGDGAIDCADAQCAVVPPCHAGGAADYLFCLVEGGCGCTLGVDCPDEEPAWGNCQAACQGVPLCSSACVDAMSEESIADYFGYTSCLQEHCSGATTDQEFAECFDEHCAEAYASWIFSGESPCDVFFDCTTLCQDSQACVVNCFTQLSTVGYQDFASYQACQFALCDSDGNGELDSDGCATFAFLACAGQGGGCFELESAQSGESCSSVLDCFTACAGQGPATAECITPCYALLDFDHLADLSSLVTCAVGACGTFPGELSLPCIAEAALGACSAEYAQCGGQLPAAEICDNRVDDDGDGQTDCQDETCADLPECAPAEELTSVWIQAVDGCIAGDGLSPQGPTLDAVAILGPDGKLEFAQQAAWVGEGTCSGAEPTLAALATGKLDGGATPLDGLTLRLEFPVPYAALLGDVLVFEVGGGALVDYAVSISPSTAQAPELSLGQGAGTAAFPIASEP
jgi:hypothetical protein